MIAAGINTKALSTYMGHASITITLDRYGHLLPGNEAQAASTPRNLAHPSGFLNRARPFDPARGRRQKTSRNPRSRTPEKLGGSDATFRPGGRESCDVETEEVLR